MPTFELTAEQEATLFAELVETEKYRDNGVVFGQIFSGEGGKMCCRAQHVDQVKAVAIKKILSRTRCGNCGEWHDPNKCHFPCNGL
jgi:hypothetical protein